MYLVSAYEDTLDVHGDDEERVGQIAPSFDGWAVYRTTATGAIQERRVATTKTIAEAVERLASL